MSKLSRITVSGIACDCDTCKDIYNYKDKTREDFYHDINEQIVLDEGSFSWYPCDLCNSPLGGTRYIAHSFNTGVENKELEHLNICVDCLMDL